MKSSVRSIGLPEYFVRPTFLPSQPLLISIANSTKKGCNRYYRLLRKRITLQTNMSARQDKWHTELGCIMGADFWNAAYKLNSEIMFDNKSKWLQYQITRNSLYTNYKVNKFNNQISPYCNFCTKENTVVKSIELVSHLFVQCAEVKRLWEEVITWLGSLGVILAFDTKILLFGYHEQPFDSVLNFIILCVKSFIWKSKHAEQNLNCIAFKKYLYFKLFDLKNAYLHKGIIHDFVKWNSIFDNLCTLQE